VFYSFTGFIEAAKDENAANQNISEISNILFEGYETEEEMFGMALIFETENIDNFMKALQENITQFLKNYKENNDNV
jgi:hypothetical protein